METLTIQRVVAYIDGFNLYFGLKTRGWRSFYWLDIQKLAQNLLKPDQKLVLTKYFTSRVKAPPSKVKRQSIYIEALETLDEFEIFYGKYQLNSHECPNCKSEYIAPSEKMTDVKSLSSS